MAGFVKLMRSSELLEVLEHYPKAFLLLTLVAIRARRDGDRINPHALELGEALAGDSRAVGLSRQEYRTALDKLEAMGLVTTRATNKGTIIRLTDSSIYDINASAEQPTAQPLEKPTAQPKQAEEVSQVQPIEPTAAPTTKKKEVKEAKKEEEALIAFVVEYLNQKAGKDFRPSTKETAAAIRARIAEGRTKEDFVRVIDTKVAKWANDPKMADYLRPSTLFRPSHFEAYLNEAPIGAALVTDLAALEKLKNESAAAYSEMVAKIVEAGYRPAYKKGAENRLILAGYVNTRDALKVQQLTNGGWVAEKNAEGSITKFLPK